MDNVIISIEAVCSGMNLLDIEISNELTIKELYERIQEELEIDDDFILFKEYDYDNELIISKKSIRDVYGNEKDIKLTLFNKIYTEREILEIFYKSTNGPSWNRNDNWLSDKPLSEWFGITVHENSNEKFIVKEIKLGFNKLSGEIPKEIGKLINLEYLSLNNNQLTGEIPKEIGKLVNLEWLYLYNNQLSGEIPKEVQELKCFKKF